LANFVLKGLEKIVQGRLKINLAANPLQFQHGFTKGLSCDTAVAMLIDCVEKQVLGKGICLAVFLDISSAFDTVQFDDIKAQLYNRGINPRIILWYNHFLRNRLIESKSGSIIIRKQPTQGAPQGGACSADMWNLVDQTLLDLFQGLNVEIIGFADDAVLLIGGKNIYVLHDQMQNALDMVEQWGQQKKLQFNSKKSCVIIFTNK
jgi:hypothetical protein